MAALPAIVADGSDVLVLDWLAPIVEMSGAPGEVIPFRRGGQGFVRAVRELRRRAYREGVLLTPAFSAAWLFRCGGVSRLRGTATDGRGVLLADRVAPETLRPFHRVDAYRRLLEQDLTGELRPVRLTPPASDRERWRVRLPVGDGPVVGMVPGSNAPARRWPAERFGEVASWLGARGARVVVTGSPREADLTAGIARRAPGSLDTGGRTAVTDLAALLSLCDLVITNDTGAMHLAGAVGTPTVSLWGSSDPTEVRQVGAPDRRVTGPDLPCRPCRRNHCARRGAGTILADAHEECMRLIEVGAVLEALDAALPEGGPGAGRGSARSRG
ncbi:MAG: glycosyltransferase family 9 protein [Gemmatimonadales bacterium]